MSITVSELTYYKAGTVVKDSEIAGYSGGRRVIRYTLKVSGEGASELSIQHKFSSGSSSKPTLCVNISTGSDDYANANGDTNGYLAIMTRTSTVGAYEATLTNLTLIPGQTYYLWVYPMTDTSSWVYYHAYTTHWSVTGSGSVGLVYIDNGSSFDTYMVYIDNGSSWDMYLPHIDNGSSWDLLA